MDQTRKGLTDPKQLEALKRELEEASSPTYAARQKRKRILKKIFGFVLIVLILSLLYFSIIILSAKKEGSAKVIGDIYLYSVTDNSMSPEITPGTVIMAYKPADAYRLTSGTVVAYKNSKGEKVMSRITQVTRDEQGRIFYTAKIDIPNIGVFTETLVPESIEAIYLFKIPLI